MTDRKEDRAWLRAYIRQFHGNLSAMASQIGIDTKHSITRQGLSQLLERRGLGNEAAAARARHGVTGQRRSDLPNQKSITASERERYLLAAARYPTYVAAAKALGVSERQFYRKVKLHRISPREISRRAAR